MTGPPVSALCPPGMCQFGPEFTSVPLLERTKVSPTSSVLRFGLPKVYEPLNLSTCACILANAKIEGEEVVRPYTPISTNSQKGSFDLLVKDYGPGAKMSRHMCEGMEVGDEVNFKHIDFNVKLQAPFDYDEILMIVGGTGITPMIQALHAILGDKDKKQPKVTMLYGSKSSDDILGKEMVDAWAENSDSFELVHILSHEPEDSEWKGERGFIGKELISKLFPAADSGSKLQIFVCGPPPLYNALSGPREESDKVSGLLGEMGYQPNQVYKF